MGTFWTDTRKKVIAHQRRRVQSWFIQHPITFGLALGAKGLAWDAPSWGVRKIRGKAKKVKKPDGTVTTTIETVDADGKVSATTMTRTVEGGPAATAIASGPTARRAPTRMPTTPMTPDERRAVVASSKTLLMRTPMGKAFCLVASEIDNFTPVRGIEAVSTATFMQQLAAGYATISMGLEAWCDIVAMSGLHRNITGRINAGAEEVDIAAKAMARTHKTLLAQYSGQIDQDLSAASTISAVPVRQGVGDGAVGLKPYCATIANLYGTAELDLGAEATQVQAGLRISQAGFALVAEVMGATAARMKAHGINQKITRMFDLVASDLVKATVTFRYASREMARLYQGQLDHEASGTSTIRTTPLRTAA